MTCHALILRKDDHQGETVRPDTVFYYRSLRVDELERTVGKMLERIEGKLGRVDADLRDQLLPALLVMRERVKPGHWQRFLYSHNLNPATIRKWRERQKASTTSLLHLLGEPQKARTPQRMPGFQETETEALFQAAKRGFEELLKGNVKFAEKLGKEFLEAFGALG